MRLFILILALGLTGCATQAKYERVVASWVGNTEEALVYKWGPPARTYSLNSGKVLTYEFDGGATAYANNVYGSVFVNQVRNYCETSFFTNSVGIIESWRFEGNSCRAE